MFEKVFFAEIFIDVGTLRQSLVYNWTPSSLGTVKIGEIAREIGDLCQRPIMSLRRPIIS